MDRRDQTLVLRIEGLVLEVQSLALALTLQCSLTSLYNTLQLWLAYRDFLMCCHVKCEAHIYRQTDQRDRTHHHAALAGGNKPTCFSLFVFLCILSQVPLNGPRVANKRFFITCVRWENKSSSADEIPERDVTYHLLCLLIYHWTTTHL